MGQAQTAAGGSDRELFPRQLVESEVSAGMGEVLLFEELDKEPRGLAVRVGAIQEDAASLPDDLMLGKGLVERHDVFRAKVLLGNNPVGLLRFPKAVREV